MADLERVLGLLLLLGSLVCSAPRPGPGRCRYTLKSRYWFGLRRAGDGKGVRVLHRPGSQRSPYISPALCCSDWGSCSSAGERCYELKQHVARRERALRRAAGARTARRGAERLPHPVGRKAALPSSAAWKSGSAFIQDHN